MIKKTTQYFGTLLLALVLTIPAVKAETVGIFFDSTIEQIKFAAGDVKTALEAKSFTVEMLPLNNLNATYPNKKVVIALQSNTATKTILSTQGGTFPTGLKEQGYGLRTTNTPQLSFWVVGADANGAMYGGLQIAENINFYGLTGTYNNEESPAIIKRGIKLNYPLDKRSPTYGKRDDGTFDGIAFEKAIQHVWDFDYWTEWFDHMARNRYNMVSVWLCHPFTSLVKMANYPDVVIPNIQGFDGFAKTMTIEQKIEFWRKVMRYAHDRGFEFYFVNWNIFTFGATNKYGITNNIDNQATKTYMYESMKALLGTYPDLDGFGITAGEKMAYNQHAKNAQWLWDTYGKATYDYSLQNPNRKTRFIFRYHYADLSEIKQKFQPLTTLSNVTFNMSFKYSQAHMYAASAPKWWDTNEIKALQDNGLKTFFTLRNDDFYYHNWGNPDFARAYINGMPGKDSYLEGFYMGSDGYAPTRNFFSKNSISQNTLEVKRQWYMNMIWGRLAYNPNTSDDIFKNQMALRYSGVSSSNLFEAWKKASSGVPKVSELVGGTLYFDFHWWPEGCQIGRSTTNSSFVTIDRFIVSKVVPGSALASIEASALNTAQGKTTSLQLANEIEADAQMALTMVKGITANANTELGLALNNIKAMSYLSIYYAYKIRGATYKKANNGAETTTALGQAYCWWMQYANLMDSMYEGMTMQRSDDFPNWHHQDANVLKEYTDNGGIGVPKCTNTALAPNAQFKADNTNVSPGQTVNFTDQSTNTPTSWLWSFEGGNPATSTNQNPSVSYSKLGTYSVNLNATNALGVSELVKTGYITVTNNLPVTTLTDWVSGTTNNKVSGSNRLMTVMVMGEHGSSDISATSVTYGGLTMTKLTERVFGTGFRTYASIFTLNETGVNAATSGTINVTWNTAPTGFNVYSVLLANVDQTTPISISANNALTGTSVTTTAMTAASGDMVIMCGATADNKTITFNNGFAKTFESNATWGDGTGGNKMGTGVIQTPKFSQSASGRMVICAMVVKNAYGANSALFAPQNKDISFATDSGIHIYPNPSSSILNIEFGESDINKKIKIFNILGELVHQLETKNARTQLNVKSLNLSGALIIQVIHGNTVTNQKILIKK